MLPDVVVHADWGTHPKKRVAAIATLSNDRYFIDATRQVGEAGPPRERLGVPAGHSGKALIGFDFPIGLPVAYAQRAGIDAFRDVIEQFGAGDWGDFFRVCVRPDEIHLRRPFFPHSCPKPGMYRREDLTNGLGLSWEELHRRCDLKTASNGAASPMFWTLGGKQVGKAAISGWREFIQPLLCGGGDVALWPFDGLLPELLPRHSCVIVETYPAVMYGQLGLKFPGGKGGGKTSQPARRALGPAMLAAADRLGAHFASTARNEVLDGFGASRDGEDRFDAMTGLLGMIQHVLDGASEPPDHPSIRSIEGWMVGQQLPSDGMT